jgi:hypothetical protein
VTTLPIVLLKIDCFLSEQQLLGGHVFLSPSPLEREDTVGFNCGDRSECLASSALGIDHADDQA